MNAMRGVVAGVALAVVTVLLAGCGGGSKSSAAASTKTSPAAAGQPSSEVNPAGDIPDNQVYVAFSPGSGLFSVKVPEGWARTATGPTTMFSDKLNSIRVEAMPAAAAPTAASATSDEIPRLKAQTPGLTLGKITTVQRKAGPALEITYRAQSAPDPVTGKVVTDAVERYEFWRSGQEVALTLSGPQGADNVDPWRIVTDSFGWSK